MLQNINADVMVSEDNKQETPHRLQLERNLVQELTLRLFGPICRMNDS